MFDGVFNTSMLKKAQEIGAVEFSYIDLRQYGIGPRKQVDDIPYGGGDGMVLRPEPIIAAIEDAKKQSPKAQVILPTPRGELFNQGHATHIAKSVNDLIFVCPRYEGYDERITEYVDTMFRVGNYVLTGGELPVMTMIDAIVRLLPGVLGGETSAEKESFQHDENYIEHPQYTRPEEHKGKKVPNILLSGNHAQIDAWRKQHSQQIDQK